MKKAILLVIILSLLFPLATPAAPVNQVKAAFIREGNVWILLDGKEKQITNTGNVHSKPKWSKDGTHPRLSSLSHQLKGSQNYGLTISIPAKRSEFHIMAPHRNGLPIKTILPIMTKVY